MFALPLDTVRSTESMRRSVSEAALAQPEGLLNADTLKTLTINDLSFKSSTDGNTETSGTPEMSLSMETLGPSTPSEVNFFLRPEKEEADAKDGVGSVDRGPRVRAAFPDGFHPRRSSQGVLHMPLYSSPIVKNPFMSPLLAPDSMLKTLPPVHLVVRTRLPREGGGLGSRRVPWGKEQAEGGGAAQRASERASQAGYPLRRRLGRVGWRGRGEAR